jgi:hypothetical protein
MLITSEEIQISETTTSFQVRIDKVYFAKTLDECYEQQRDSAKEIQRETPQQSLDLK